jgi:hypothetical protein
MGREGDNVFKHYSMKIRPAEGLFHRTIFTIDLLLLFFSSAFPERLGGHQKR